MMNKIISVWGSSSSGKTTTSMKLATELANSGHNVIVILSDLSTPSVSVVAPQVDLKGKTLGNLLAKPHIKLTDINHSIITHPKNDRIGIIGYKNGDNIFTYPEFIYERVIEFFNLLREVVDYVIIDCSSVLTEDGFSTIALQHSDKVIRLCNADLKSYSFFTSQLPLISRSKFRADEHIKVLSNLKDFQEELVFKNLYENIRYTLPYVNELEQQMLSASLEVKLKSKESKSYNNELEKLVKEFFGIVK